MADRCELFARCRNKEGQEVDSKLFKDLLSYSSNDRAFAKKLYYLAINQDFLNQFGQRLQFDVNGLPTLKSLLEVTNTSIDQQRLLQFINKEFGAGVYDWNEALNKVGQFNREAQSNPERKDYVAVMYPKGNNRYKIQIEQRTSENEAALRKNVLRNDLQSKLISLLRKYGVAVDFLEKGLNRYSTENAEQTADGLYHLIQIVNGNTVTEELAEEAGHFAVAALGNSPLVDRLMNILTPEIQKEALGEETYNSKYLGKNARREVAGALVGQALINKGKKGVWSSLANRIADLAKRVFYTIKGDEVKLARMKAQQLADNIATGFMSLNFEGNIDNALNVHETLYSAEYTQNVKVYKEITAQLQTAINELKAMNSSLAASFESIVAITSIGRDSVINQNMTGLSDNIALGGIAEAADQLLQLMSIEIPNLLNTVDFNNTLDFTTNMSRNGHSLREAHIATVRCIEIAKILSRVLSKDANTGKPLLVGDLEAVQGVDLDNRQHIYRNLYKISDSLAKFTNESARDGFYYQLINKEAQFFLKFLTDSYGSNYVERSARVLFNFKNLGKGRKLIEFKQPKPNENTLDYLLGNLEEDINFFDRFLSSMANSGDIIGGIVDKVTKQANKQADDIVNNVWDRLKALEYKMKEAGIKDSTVLYERDANGNLTGNIISDKLWGIWEQEYEDFVKQEKQNFLELKKDDTTFEQLSEFQKAFMWQQYFEPKRKEWHKGVNGLGGHSIFDREEGKWIPNNSYKNDKYDELSPDVRYLIGELMDIKLLLDSLTDNAMPSRRAPQFKGTFMNRVRNRGSRLNIKNYGKGFWETVRETFCVDVDDAAEFGSYLTYNNESEDMFDNQIAFEKEKLNRLALFGINKLSDMNTLSTDIFGSMLAYAGMAAHYAAMNLIVDTVEIGKEVLNERKVGGVTAEKNTRGELKSWAYQRYIKYLDKQIYGVSAKPIVLSKGLVLNKLVNFCSGLASKIFLGGNVAGGIVNLGTGVNEIFKEAMSGEYYNIKDWNWATALYFANLPDAMLHSGTLRKNDKLSLLMSHFNILGDNKREQRDYSTYKSWLHILYDKSLLLPYTAGDHYMQSMSYLALMHNIKVVDKNGKKMNLYDAYKVKNITYTDTMGNETTKRKYGKTIELDGDYFKSEEDRQEYMFVEDLLSTIENAPKQGVFGPAITLTDEQLKYLDDNKLSLANLETTAGMLKNKLNDLKWNTDDESALMDKAREINDRLHGIYNDLDKTAFHQNIIGNALLAMRGYALGMIQRRYGAAKYSVALGGETEGSMITVAKMVAAMFTDQWGFGRTILAILMPFAPSVKTKMEKAGFSSNQYRNMRRNFGDLLLIAALTLLKMLTADDEDDEETEDAMKEYYKSLKKKGYSQKYIDLLKLDEREKKEINPVGIMYYFTSRLLREQAAFTDPHWIPDEWTLISSLEPAGVSVLQTLWQFSVNCYGDIVYDYEEIDNEYYEHLIKIGYSKEKVQEMKEQDRKAIEESEGRKYFYQQNHPSGMYKKGDAKWEIKMKSLLPYYRFYNGVLYHPYEAAKGYDYGRQVKVR